MQSTENEQTVGVQQLIDRIKSEGVQEGQQQAEAVLVAAKKEAAAILASAREEAESIENSARENAEKVEANGKRALALAARDTSLQLKEQLEQEFEGWVGGLVETQLAEPEFLSNLICEMAQRAVDSLGKSVEVHTAMEQTESIESLVRGQAAEMLRQGVEIRPTSSVQQGFRLRIEDQHAEVEFTADAVTEALMRLLAPKFREIVASVTLDSPPAS